MAVRIFMLLGRGTWSRGSGKWTCETPGEDGGYAAHPVECLSRMLSRPFRGRTVLVFEPRGMAHPSTETPKVSRSVFASLSRVRSEHPVVSSESLGWGIEPPEPASGGTFATLMHYEMMPGLARLQDSGTRSGCPLSAAWSPFTVGAALSQVRHGAQKVRFVVFLVPGFVGVASLVPGKRSFRAWADPMVERDWKVFSGLIGDFDERAPGSAAEVAPSRGFITVVAQGEPANLCPIWGQIRGSGTVAHVLGLDDFAECAAQVPVGHPANLLEPFPQPRNMDRFLACVFVTGLLAASAFAYGAVEGKQRAERDESGEAVEITSLATRLRGLRSNHVEIDRLKGQLPGGPLPQGFEPARAMRQLASALPESVTLSRLTLGSAGGFRIEAYVVADNFKSDEARRQFSNAGFGPRSGDGWAYESIAGTLVVCGTFSPRSL